MIKAMEYLVENGENYLAHNENVKETIIDHSKGVLNELDYLNNETDCYNRIRGLIDLVFKNRFKENPEIKELLFEALINVFYLHDIGKINPRFQKDKMNNDAVSVESETKELNSLHSQGSTIIYLNEEIGAFKKLYDEGRITLEDFYVIIEFCVVISQCIYKHHSYLEDHMEYIEKLKNLLIDDKNNSIKELRSFSELRSYKGLDNLKYISKVLSIKPNLESFENSMFILVKYIFSLLVLCDYSATCTLNYNEKMRIIGIDDEFINKYKKSFYNRHEAKICLNDNIKSLNTLRDMIYIESEEKLLANKDENIFYLESPTGSGKTNVATNLALRLIENNNSLNKIIYATPYNIIGDAVKEFLGKIWSHEEFRIINSESSIYVKENESMEKTLLDYKILNSSILLVSHVKLLDIFFGNSKKSQYNFATIVGSVVIIDEVQTINVEMWSNFINTIRDLSKLLNIKFILMSGTLPHINRLLSHSHGVKLLDSDKYYKCSLFSERVKKYDYSMLDNKYKSKKDVFENITHKIDEILKRNCSSKKILIEFISKASSREFYKYLMKKVNDVKIIQLDGDDSLSYRKKVINDISNFNSIIVISTQIIEAGVDIDMDFGFKNISFFDSEEQFCGRINRNALKIYGEVYFFNLDNSNEIYYKNKINFKNNLTLENLKMREILERKDFNKVFDILLNRIYSSANESSYYSSSQFKRDLQLCNFSNVKNKMKLIDDELKYFLMVVVESRKDYNKLWEKLENAVKIIDYADRVINLNSAIVGIQYYCNKVSYSQLNKILAAAHIIKKFNNIYYLSVNESKLEILSDNNILIIK